MEGDSLIEDLIAFAQVEASQFLADMFAVWLFEYRPNGPADALRYLFEKGDRGHFLDGAYNRRTGRALFTDIRELLERWIADLRHNPARQLMRLSDDRWQPVSDGQLSRIVPPAPTGSYGQADALRPLMRDLTQGLLDFGGRKHAAGVFRRAGQSIGPQPEGLGEAPQSRAPMEAVAARCPRRGPLSGTTDRIEQERRALVPILRARRHTGEPYRDTIIRLEKEGAITLPGRGTPENNRDELARVWGAVERLPK